MIEQYIKSRAKQTAVYWAAPTPAQDGSNTFVTPVEIKCIWVNQTQLSIDRNGKEVSITAKIYVSQDLDEQGMVYLGLLTDLTATQKSNPRKVKKAYEITTFSKTPSMYKNGQYYRCALISPKKSID